MGTDFRMTHMLREMSECIRTMPTANGDQLHIMTIENRSQIVVATNSNQFRVRGRESIAVNSSFILSRLCRVHLTTSSHVFCLFSFLVLIDV